MEKHKLNSSLMKMFSPSEWVCITFIVLSLFCIFLTSAPIQWTGVKWSVFPKADLLFVAWIALILKFFKGDSRRITLLLTLSLMTYFGFSGLQEDPILPVKQWLGQSANDSLQRIRWAALLISGGIFLQPFYKDAKKIGRLLEQARTILPLLIMPLLYPLIPLMMNTAQLPDQDAALHSVDFWLFFSHDPIVLLENITLPFISEWMAFSYSFYGIFFLSTFALLFLKENSKPTRELIFNITLTFALGYWGYVLIPAKGPLFTETFKKSLDLYYMKDIQYALMDHRRIERDCFPSLHTAITLVTLFSTWKHLRKFFWICLPFAATIPIACVYLRYHYVVDVLAGAALAAFVVKTVPRLQLYYQKNLAPQKTA